MGNIMFKKKSTVIILSLLAAMFLITSCGEDNQNDSGKVPIVVVDSGDDLLDDTSLDQIVINPEGGNLDVNGESIAPSVYNSNNGSTTVTAVNGAGDCTVVVNDNGSITIQPSGDTVEGTYVVTIDTGDREYILIIAVTPDENGDGIAEIDVTTSISYPSGSSIILDLTDGKLINTLTGKEIIITDTGLSGKYIIAVDIKVTGGNGEIIAKVDPITGDIIADGDLSGPYTIVITTPDGSVITVITDNNGKITAITVNNATLILDLDNGSVGASNYNFSLTASSSDGQWSLGENVEILSITAAGGALTTIDISRVWINQSTGDIMIGGSNGAIAPVGPYEIKVSIENHVYIIKTDATGQIVSIIPGNVLLELTQGILTYSGNNVLTIANNNNGWALASDTISQLSAVDASGNSIAITIDPDSGNFVTDQNITGIVTITFIYTDSQDNGITYTITVLNGSVHSYIAEITDPSSDFDFSTVTNIKVFLNVVDGTTGSPVKQASINLANAQADQNWKGFTNDLGVSIFTATVTTASQTTSVAVTHGGYETVISPIDGIGKLIEIGKKIAMTPITVVDPPVDTDGDGVSDEDDDYPNDSNGAKKISGSYTLAFEDQYTYNSSEFNTSTSSGNDADFNDLIIRLTIEEKIDSQNKVREIKVIAKPIAALSGNSNSFGIYVKGIRYIMIIDSKGDSSEQTLVVSFDEGIDRNLIGPMPYDPFMVPNGFNVGTDGPNEVHLASVSTTYGGVRTGNGLIKTGVEHHWFWGDKDIYADINGFVWALMLPENWQWPKEGTSIGIAYPDFIDWCNSDGKEKMNWYNSPTTDNITSQYGL